jgi:hypothetical protein
LPIALGGALAEVHYQSFIEPHKPYKQGTWPLCHLSNHKNYTIMHKTLSLLSYVDYANISNEGKKTLQQIECK